MFTDICCSRKLARILGVFVQIVGGVHLSCRYRKIERIAQDVTYLQQIPAKNLIFLHFCENWVIMVKRNMIDGLKRKGDLL